MKKKICIGIIIFFILFLVYITRPTWTPRIKGSNSISEYKKVKINGTKLQVLIRGEDKDNPVILYVHGGPASPDLYYIREYQDLLEKDFVVVDYAERGSGKSYNFFEDYSNNNIDTNVDDLVELTKYIKDYLNKDKIIIVGHSWGSYIGMKAIEKNPDDYIGFVGVGQVVDSIKSEQITYDKMIKLLEEDNDEESISYLESLKEDIDKGMYVPINILNRYGYLRHKSYNTPSLFGAWVNSEYNFIDSVRQALGNKYCDILWDEVIERPLDKEVNKVQVPVYMVMGKYDGSTSPELAKEYFDNLEAPIKEYYLFEDSAHFPHIEEEDKFYDLMIELFKNT